jgi:hypothetical protein
VRLVLEVCACISALLFLAALAATASRCAGHRAGGAYPASASAGNLWAMVPWVIDAAGALPPVRLILAALQFIVATLRAVTRAPPFPRPCGKFLRRVPARRAL